MISDRVDFFVLSTLLKSLSIPKFSISDLVNVEVPIPSFLSRSATNLNSLLLLGVTTIAFIHQIYKKRYCTQHRHLRYWGLTSQLQPKSKARHQFLAGPNAKTNPIISNSQTLKALPTGRTNKASLQQRKCSNVSGHATRHLRACQTALFFVNS